MIRLLLPADIPAAMRLKEAAGWNQTPEDWANLLALEPEGCFALECDGTVAATTTAVCYGKELAWIGMVLTAPEYRGRGFARRLMEHALEFLRGRDVAWIKLDATDVGRPLYLKLGFEDESLIERWAGVGVGAAGEDKPGGLSHLALDREAFGADRSAVLARLSRWEVASLPDGYAMGRPGTKAFYFGPCVCRTPEAARELLRCFLARHSGETLFWDILPGNNEALRLAREFGFERRRQLVRQALPGASPFPHNDGLVYGTAGFEYG
ncbi:MAG: GNAT family N-acetyltransferase [Acidobacteriota bacterium]